ncbi:MAG: 2-dehydropantoate 2-reductase [Pseudomonadota bacterium]
MRIVIFGTGGVGGYFGTRLAESGHDVLFIARGDHLERINSDGLILHSHLGDARLTDVRAATAVPDGFAPDLVLMCVKTWQLEAAASQLKPAIAAHSAVLPLLNGVEAPDVLAKAIGREHVLAGLCGIIAYIEAPGVVRHAAVDPFLKFGELDNSRSSRARDLQAVFDDTSGIDADVPDDIQAALWMKFLFIASTSGVGAVTRAPMGVFRSQPETRELLVQSMEEIYRLAVARGVALRDNAVERTMQMVDSLPPGGTSSMQRDLMNGRQSELEEQTGAVVRLSAEAGLSCPVNHYLYASLLPAERLARQEITLPGE